MNSKWKFITLMILTLVIGIAFGALLNRALIQSHIRHAMQMRATGFFGPGEKMLLRSATPGQRSGSAKSWTGIGSGSAKSTLDSAVRSRILF